jgi:DNA-binding NarL/FixJ family response regulator
MYVLKSARLTDLEEHAPRDERVTGRGLQSVSPGDLPTVLYLDARAFTRDCVGGWLQSSLSGFHVLVLQNADQIETRALASDAVQAVIINAGPERMSSATMTRLLSRLHELFPGVPMAVLSDYEDAENIREAFNLGVQGYIPTSLASRVAIGAVHLVCVGGTFVPAAMLLSDGERRQAAAGEPLIEGFTQRQSQILDCLRRGMANKLIAYELDMCESTVKVHIRNIMKKLNATNRTQVAYLTRGYFEGQHQPA